MQLARRQPRRRGLYLRRVTEVERLPACRVVGERNLHRPCELAVVLGASGHQRLDYGVAHVAHLHDDTCAESRDERPRHSVDRWVGVIL